jgi:HD-GYP domain-containing protein (c-di-GMP phosphodiesterase class II)
MKDTVQIRIEDFAVGVPCRFDVNDDLGILLLAAGNSLTESLRDQLIQRGTTFLEVSPEDADALMGKDRSRGPVAKKSKPSAESKRLAGLKRQDRSSENYCSLRAKAFHAQLSKSVDELAGMGRRIDHLSNHDMHTACEIPKTLLSMLLDDGDQTLSSLGAGKADDFLANRCTQMSMLAMNTGIEMGLNEDRVSLLGQAGLLHDFGLYRLAPHLRDPRTSLNHAMRETYRKHPFITQDLLKGFSATSDEVCVIVGQVHERPNGNGYPRGLRSNITHPLASVLSVVDGYLSLVEHGPGRPPIQPHDALAVLLHEGARGLFDSKALRAFLLQMTLFPIGSRVLLDDQSTATVMRRDGAHYSTPIIRPDDSEDFVSTRNGQRSIVSPILSSEDKEMRLPADSIATTTIRSLVAVA